MKEAEFLQRIARRLSRSWPPPPPGWDAAASLPPPLDRPAAELVDDFVAALTARGGRAYRCADRSEVQSRIREVVNTVAQNGPVALWHHPLLDAWRVADTLTAAGVPLLYGGAPELDRQALATARAGITAVDLAVAETGTLVLRAGPGRDRSTSLVPPVHLALVPVGCIVPALVEVFRQLSSAGNGAPPSTGGGALPSTGGGALPSSVVLITGPSRSADIENDLSIGVHGPGVVVALVVPDTGPSG